MLRKIVKWVGITLGSLVVLLLVGYLFISANMINRSEKHYAFTKETLTIPTDTATLSRGKHLAIIKGCTDCHGPNLAGRTMINEKPLGRLSASNLTKGKGGLPADYSTADWVMALRHGVDQTGKPLLFMPAHETTLLSKADMTDIIAYCQQMPPVDNELPPHDLGPVTKVMSYLDKMPLLAVEKIDHNKPMVMSVDTTVGIAQGKYLAISCSGCHRENMKGGDPVAPGFPPVANITSSGHIGQWTQAQFIQTLRSGVTPSGHKLDNEYMPWKMAAQYNNNELASVYQYLRSLR